ncbi:MAG: RluA family pseudouridine synthase [Phycisphaerae bacterium]|nr:RluA family pseudouridine synthase [Phycisphaerae bacterium]
MTAPRKPHVRGGAKGAAKRADTALPDSVDDAPDTEPLTSEHAGLVGPGGAVDRDALFALYEQQSERDDEAPVKVTFKLLRDLDKRLDRYLVDRVPFLSRTQIQKLIDEEAVTVNGRVPKSSTKLRKNDVITATLPPPPSGAIQPEELELDVLFEDEHIIVLNKQAGLIVHPARAHKTGTLVNGLAWRFKHISGGQLSAVGEEFARPGIVHRLDKWTSGAIVAAKNDTAHWRLGKQFEHRRTDKRYLAVVHGRVEPDIELIDLPLGKHPVVREKNAVRFDETGKPSQTIWRVREVYEAPFGAFTLVELELKTGRTHQIRVHMSHMRHAIVGDDMYGGKHVTERELGGDTIAMLMTHQALHATTLSFKHPMTDVPMRFLAPITGDLRRAIELLRKNLIRRAEPVGSTIDLATAMAGHV